MRTVGAERKVPTVIIYIGRNSDFKEKVQPDFRHRRRVMPTYYYYFGITLNGRILKIISRRGRESWYVDCCGRAAIEISELIIEDGVSADMVQVSNNGTMLDYANQTFMVESMPEDGLAEFMRILMARIRPVSLTG